MEQSKSMVMVTAAGVGARLQPRWRTVGISCRGAYMVCEAQSGNGIVAKRDVC